MNKQEDRLWAFAERAGPWLTGLCAVHCLVLPIGFAVTASMAVSLLSWKHPFHDYATLLLHLGRWEALWVGIGVAATLGSLVRGFRRHGGWGPAAWLMASATVFALALAPIPMRPWPHAVLMAAGSLLLVVATVHERRLRRTR